jgi:hypothetical protein
MSLFKGFKKHDAAIPICKMDIDFYQESKKLEIRLRAVILEIGKIANTKYHTTQILESLNWLKPYGVTDGTNFSFNVRGNAIRYTGIFTDYTCNLGMVFLGIEHEINRWKIYKIKKLSGKQMERGIRFLERFIPENAFTDNRKGCLAKGYTFDLRKYLRGKK